LALGSLEVSVFNGDLTYVNGLKYTYRCRRTAVW
jgi:hypothetical protein